MPSITLSTIEKESKGRNGWFHPARAAILYGPHDTIAVEIWSKRETGEPPIDLYLTPQDAVLLGSSLQQMGGSGASGQILKTVFDKTDWSVLKDQKLALLEVLSGTAHSADPNPLDGLLSWIDAIQDAAKVEGYPVEFLMDVADNA